MVGQVSTLPDGIHQIVLAVENECGDLNEWQRVPGVQVLHDVAKLSRRVLGSCDRSGYPGDPAAELGVIHPAWEGHGRGVGSSPRSSETLHQFLRCFWCHA